VLPPFWRISPGVKSHPDLQHVHILSPGPALTFKGKNSRIKEKESKMIKTLSIILLFSKV
jgi:hypothetical protein